MTPKYGQRFDRLPQILNLLAQHPSGMGLDELAKEVGLPPNELRTDLIAYFRADVNAVDLFGLTRPHVISFLAPDGSEDDPGTAQIVRVDDPRPTGELGVEYISGENLALLYESARLLLETEPDNADLAAAMAVLAESVTTGAGAESPGADVSVLDQFKGAVEQRQQVRITYSRAWRPGVGTRVVHPYRLVHTKRGWEVDAGPLDDTGAIRTFLLSNVRDLEVLPGTFTMPKNVDEAIAANRAPTTVDVVLPNDKRWVADRFAERVQVIRDDETGSQLRLDMLEPLGHRVGLLLLTAGEDAFVTDQGSDLQDSDAELARLLLDHHFGTPDPR